MKPLEIDKETTTSVLFTDKCRVVWGGPTLPNVMQCNCIVARKCKNGKQQMCQHIRFVLIDKRDRCCLLRGQNESIWLCVLLATKDPQGSDALFVKIDVQTEDEFHTREIWWDVDGGHDLFIGYISEPLSRLALREIVWPHLVEFALKAVCTACMIPPEIACLGYGSTVEEQMSAIRTALFIHNDQMGACPACSVSALIPDLDI